MTKISIYPEIAVPTVDDLLIGTDKESNDSTKNFKISDVLELASANVFPYKSYVCLLTQSGTLDPVVTVLYNNIGVITWSRGSAGIYVVNSSGLFIDNKTVAFCQVSSRTTYPTWQTIEFVSVKGDGDNFLKLEQFDVDGDYIDILQGTMVEIRVYN